MNILQPSNNNLINCIEFIKILKKNSINDYQKITKLFFDSFMFYGINPIIESIGDKSSILHLLYFSVKELKYNNIDEFELYYKNDVNYIVSNFTSYQVIDKSSEKYFLLKLYSLLLNIDIIIVNIDDDNILNCKNKKPINIIFLVCVNENYFNVKFKDNIYENLLVKKKINNKIINNLKYKIMYVN